MQVLRRLDRARYRTQQLGWRLNGMVMQEVARRVAGEGMAPLEPVVIQEINARLSALLDRDLDNVEQGLYPRELLFQIPLLGYVRALPALLRDAPRVVRRARAGDHSELPAAIEDERYPAYYRRTFHWQTDGYLSRHSADIYDLGVELLFGGTADVMRRQIIPPVTRFLAAGGRAPSSVRLLDLGCGTGRTLKQLAVAHPALRFHGVDLSPHYVQAARRLLADVGEVTLAVENAERLPYTSGQFDVVTSVYLFHELPKPARRQVVAEAWRVLRPGGLLVIEDSAQLSESPSIAAALASFPERFHEPFYAGYIRDDIASMLETAGFEVERTEPHLVAKVVVAQKPAN